MRNFHTAPFPQELPRCTIQGINSKKKVCTCSVQMRFFFLSIFHFSLWLVGSLDVETTEIEATCALWLCLNLPYSLASSWPSYCHPTHTRQVHVTWGWRAIVYSVFHLCCLDFEANSSLLGQHRRSQENELVQPTPHTRTATDLGPALLDEPGTLSSKCVLTHLLRERVVSECGLGYHETLHALGVWSTAEGREPVSLSAGRAT